SVISNGAVSLVVQFSKNNFFNNAVYHITLSFFVSSLFFIYLLDDIQLFGPNILSLSAGIRIYHR
ncbi:hypothetical protein FHT67_005967, partial [Paenibacillus sp. BK720]|nr:hypothetical protein [Paenibacillus sp. BK720]